MCNEVDTNIKNLITKSKNILIISHIRPDGDAIGSLLGLGLSLNKINKNTQLVLIDGVPENMKHLPGNENVIKQPNSNYDLAITVDCSDFYRTGLNINDIKPDINIDHHITNSKFAKFNIVESESVATAAVLAKHMPLWNLPIDENISECLLTGIITDTIGFRTSNMDPEAFRIIANLLEYNKDYSNIYYRSIINRSYESAKLWGVGLNNLHQEDNLVWSVVSNEDRRISSYDQSDDAELSNFLSTIDTCAISLLIMEQKNGSVKVSWRAKGNLDVSIIASHFGGGGHQAAAGADIIGTLDDIKPKVIIKTKEYLLEKTK